MKNWNILLTVLLLGSGGLFLSANACEELAEACGPCGKVSLGDASISGDAALDGFFQAVGTLDASFGKINADFEGEVKALGELYGVLEGEMSFDAYADAVLGAINADIKANASGGIEVQYQAPKCKVDVDVQFEAQAKCEAKLEVEAGCDVDIEADLKCEGGELQFACEGTCEGSCDAECTLPSCSVKVEAGAKCEGTCQGSCSIEASAGIACEGKCSGECDGDCSAYVENTSGEFECNGTCSGTCKGSCEVSGELAANCEGSCSGSCELTGELAAECTGTAGCKGECSGQCSGGCTGKASPPKCSATASAKAECDASVEASASCSASASAKAEADLSCTPPSIQIGYNFSGNADARASFEARLEGLKLHLAGILKGVANLKALVEADAAAELGLTEPPVLKLTGQVQGLVNTAIKGDFDIAKGKILCVVPALKDSVRIMGNLATDIGASITSQAKFGAIIGK